MSPATCSLVLSEGVICACQDLSQELVCPCCRVDLDCQHETSEQEAPLITACRGVFDNALPSKWALLAMLSPAALLPFIKALSQWLPTKTDTENRKANAYIYDVCVHLMQVRTHHCHHHHHRHQHACY